MAPLSEEHKMIIVLVTTGKHESVDTAKIRLFEERFQAEDYCNLMNSGKMKYWKYAQIVKDGEQVELEQPYKIDGSAVIPE
jgi:hypothetical protein